MNMSNPAEAEVEYLFLETQLVGKRVPPTLSKDGVALTFIEELEVNEEQADRIRRSDMSRLLL